MPDSDDRRNEHGPVTPFGHRPRGGAPRNGPRRPRRDDLNTPTNRLPAVRPAPVDLDEAGLPDLAAVQADDALLDALAAGMRVSPAPRYGTGSGSAHFGGGDRRYGPDDEIADILAAWKAEVDAEPIPELVDLDTAVATVLASSRPSRRLLRLAPIAAAAALVVIGMGGVTVGSASAEPGSALWPVSKVLFSERASSVEAADRVETHIVKAKVALTQGDPAAASQELKQADTDLGKVRPQEGHEQLADVQSFLAAKAAETQPGTKADLQSPLRHYPTRPVPTGAGLTQDPDPASGLAPYVIPNATTSSSSSASVVPSSWPRPDGQPDPRAVAPSSPGHGHRTLTVTPTPTTPPTVTDGSKSTTTSATTTTTSRTNN